MITRRTFLKYTGGTALTLFAFNKFGVPKAIAQISWWNTRPNVILEVPDAAADPARDANGRKDRPAGRQERRLLRDLDEAVLSSRSCPLVCRPRLSGAMVPWRPTSKRGLLLHNAPSLTIEAKWNTPVRVKWINDLMDANGNFLPHLLPVDPTLHWANPPGGTTGRDTRIHEPLASFTDRPGPLHRSGADRHARPRRGWRRRRERRLRRGLVSACGEQYPGWLCHRRHLVQFLQGQGCSEVSGSPGAGLRHLPVSEREPRLDHLVSRPRAGHDAPERVCRSGRLLHHPRRSGWRRRRARQPLRHDGRAAGPAPKENDKFPPNKTYYEIPIAIQDRSFNTDGSLFYPDTRAFFDEIVRAIHP